MRALIFTSVLSLFFYAGQAQFTHPTTGVNSENVGACMTSTCSGTYLDNGGSGNYSNNINGTYRVFCPNTATNCVTLTFTSFSLEGMVNPAGPPPLDCYYDYLTIGNGPTQNSNVLLQSPPSSSTSTTGRICGTPTVPFSYTSTDASGCLTVRFFSDGTVNMPGWSANISCAPCAAGPSASSNSDCQQATAVCTNLAISANATGPGIVADGCTPGNCPAGGENFSNWYQVLFNTSGTFGFTVAPNNAGADYDFAVYGPNLTCSTLGTPIRCNDSGNTGNTGLSTTGTQSVQTVTGSTFCSILNVTAGQTYFVVVDSWSPPSGGYNLNWGGSATFNCAVLPTEITSFDAKYNIVDKQVDLVWKTAYEKDVDYYIVERSIDGINFSELTRKQPFNLNIPFKTYVQEDNNPVINEINYYRITAVDFSGKRSHSNLQVIMFNDEDANLKLNPNPAGEEVELTFKSAVDRYWDVSLYNSRGSAVRKTSFISTQSGTNRLTLDLTGLMPGIYFTVINNGTNVVKRKLIIE